MTLQQARTLWQSDSLPDWRDALQRYPTVVAAQTVQGLVELDHWYREELPAQLESRQPAWIEAAELEDVVRWKMKRGEWRPRNLALVKANAPSAVRATSQEAFALAPDPARPIAVLSRLAGVGPATASAVLAAYRGDLYPFLDDLVGVAILPQEPPRFTASYYRRYAELLRQRSSALGAGWTAQQVGLALWSAAGGKTGR